MAASVKQERIICVLLPNKDQLDITVGVSVYSNMSQSILLTFIKAVKILFITTIIVFSPAPAEVHRAGCFQPCGRASWNQRTALLWPHNGKG